MVPHQTRPSRQSLSPPDKLSSHARRCFEVGFFTETDERTQYGTTEDCKFDIKIFGLYNKIYTKFFLIPKVLSYGDSETKKVIINELSIEQISNIKDKLKNAHIKLLFDYYYEENNDILEKYKTGNVKEIELLDDNLNINMYNFKLTISNSIYCIGFEILRNGVI